MGANIDHSVNCRPGPYVFKINGHCHHLMGSLLPSDGETPKFAQLYIYDTTNEVANRLAPFPHGSSASTLDESVVKDLIDMLNSTNCLVGLFRHASQRLSMSDNPGYKLRLLGQRTHDSRQYNDPSSDDIGGLIVGDIGDYRSKRDIVIESSSGTLQRISKLHPKFMSLQYPLLFPFGEDGYRTNISFANHDNQLDDSFISIPSDLLLHASCDPIPAIVSAIYPSISEPQMDPCYFRERAIVTPKNTTVAEINDFVLAMTSGDKHIYLSTDSISTSSRETDIANSLYPTEYINQLEFNGVPSHTLALKIGTPVMLLRNINPSIGLCNGTRLIVTQLSARVIEAQIITGSNIGNRVFIPRIIFPINEGRCPFTIKRRQFPLRLCYAMTINKSQGQSLKTVGVFLKEQVFTHGQLYVALSRVTSRKGLKIISCNNQGEPSHYAKNIVYKDIINALPRGCF
uniref:Uncharacterized protein n=1 Tax=Populus trichocarpa TaxID=3694 RepID=A0A2K1ZIH9_POPTR